MTKFRKVDVEVAEIANGYLVRYHATEDYSGVYGEYLFVATLGEVELRLTGLLHEGREAEIKQSEGDF